MTLSRKSSVPRRQYRNPPVHEVILAIHFSEPLPPEALADAKDSLAQELGKPERRTGFELRAAFGLGSGEAEHKETLAGWDFQSQDPSWLLRIQHGRLSLHFTRTASWPKGPYIGWKRIHEKYREVFELLSPVYGDLDVRRAGLRYLNRIAMPTNSSTEDWFTLCVPEPAPLRSLYSFDIRETWAEIEGYEGLSANFRLARIKIPDETLAADHVGVLLDIDVYNLLVKHAPSFHDTPEWYSRAHEAENTIFESCITDRLREASEPEDSI